MKLYIYEHCPFCLRVRTLLGLKNINMELEVLSNDDEAKPISMVGVKMVPILEKSDGSYMGESLDIVRYLDELDGEPILLDNRAPQISDWIEAHGSKKTFAKLVIPRQINMGYKEFATKEAIAYFVKKKTKMVGSFEENMSRTEELLVDADNALKELSVIIEDNSLDLVGRDFSYDDIVLFPLLLNISGIRGVEFPSNIRAYMDELSELSSLPLLFSKAI